MTRLRARTAQAPGSGASGGAAAFSYLDEDGDPIDEPEVVARIRGLGIPPAWKDVWICPWDRGHIQATASTPRAASSTSTTPTGAPGATPRSSTRCSTSPRTCPPLREQRRRRPGVRRRAHPRARAGLRGAAARPRLLPDRHRGVRRDQRELRPGHDAQAHVALEDDDTMVFDYPAKSGMRQIRAVVDPLAVDVVGKLKRRRGGGDELLAYKRRPPLARHPLGRHQRLHQGGHRQGLLRQGLPDLERDRAGRRRAGGLRRGRRRPRPAASARSRARSRRSPTTSATRRRSAAPPTSTRACSTPTRAG